MSVTLVIGGMSVSLLLIVMMSLSVGLISGLFGVGGGFLLTPLLIFLGVDPAIAVATAAPQIAASTIAALVSHWRRGNLDVKLGVILVVSSIPGTLLGVWAFGLLEAKAALDQVLHGLFALLLGGSGFFMLFEALRHHRKNQMVLPHQTIVSDMMHLWPSLPWPITFMRSRLKVSAVPLAGFAGLAGFVGTLLGIGGGFVIVPVLISVFQVPVLVAAATSSFQIFFTMVVASVLHVSQSHPVDPVLAFWLVVGGMIGGHLGSLVGGRLSAVSFRSWFALLMLAVAARFLYMIVQGH
jgi:uncharacterized membrane protein YfcA